MTLPRQQPVEALSPGRLRQLVDFNPNILYTFPVSTSHNQ